MNVLAELRMVASSANERHLTRDLVDLHGLVADSGSPSS